MEDGFIQYALGALAACILVASPADAHVPAECLDLLTDVEIAAIDKVDALQSVTDAANNLSVEDLIEALPRFLKASGKADISVSTFLACMVRNR